MVAGGERVRVYTRIRPATTREQSNGVSCSAVDEATIGVTSDAVTQREQQRKWDFDRAYAPEADQAEVYDEVGKPILDAVMQGYNGTVLAYGQTGTGKTHTLLNVGDQRNDAGLVPRLVAALFVAIKCDVRHVYKVKTSFLQIYNEQIDDLLRPKGTNLRVKPRGHAHEVEGLAAIECKSPSDLLALFDQGRKQLIYAETKMNKHSSRSHAVLQLTVSRRERVMDGSTVHQGSMITTLTSGKLTIVDLAGSERVKRSGADEDMTGRRMKEAININTSLLGLSNVMKALSTQSTHIPYRDSKLTHMLSDALGGNCRTSLVVCVSPAQADISETTAALEFGARAMKVKTNAVVNSSDVTLDAAALAADLSEALQLQAEGQLTGQMLAMEAELRERQKALADLEAMAAEDKKRKEREMSDALNQADMVRAEAARAGEEVSELRALLDRAEDDRNAAEAKARELEGLLCDEQTDREELEQALAVKARSAQQAEAAADEAAAVAAEAQAGEAEAKAAAAQARTELATFRREAAAQLAQHNKENSNNQDALAKAAAEKEARAAAAMADLRSAAEEDSAAMAEEIAGVHAQLHCVLSSLGEAEGEAASGIKTLQHRLRAATAAVVEKEAELTTTTSELTSAREELSDVREALSSARDLCSAVGEAAGEERAAKDAEINGMRIQVQQALEAQAAAVSTVEAAVTPLQELVEGLHARLANEQMEASSKITALKEAFGSLRDEYEKALIELQAGANEREGLTRRCEMVERMLAEEGRRQDELAAGLAKELSNREAELTAALDESSEKSQRLEKAAEEAAEASMAVEALQSKVHQMEAAREEAEGELRTSESNLLNLQAERARLEAEVKSLGEIAAAELAEAEAQRLAEVTRLLKAAEGAEASLSADVMALREVCSKRLEELEMAEHQLEEAKSTGSRQRNELWQRLKRQAVLQAAAVRTLQQSLNASKAREQRLAAESGNNMKSASELLAERDVELANLRCSMRSADELHAKQLAASGVTALKHGRKGKPHPRHIRCVGQRLEWGNPSQKGRGYDKGMALQEITLIEGGLVTEVTKKMLNKKAAVSEQLFLSVIGKGRTLDLEFPTRAARDEWWGTIERWREVSSGAPRAKLPMPLQSISAAGREISSAAAANTTTAPSSNATTPQRPTNSPESPLSELSHVGAQRPTTISPLPSVEQPA